MKRELVVFNFTSHEAEGELVKFEWSQLDEVAG
jgi:hypothetical protein